MNKLLTILFGAIMIFSLPAFIFVMLSAYNGISETCMMWSLIGVFIFCIFSSTFVILSDK